MREETFGLITSASAIGLQILFWVPYFKSSRHIQMGKGTIEINPVLHELIREDFENYAGLLRRRISKRLWEKGLERREHERVKSASPGRAS